jgi:hypothetical protein
MATTAKKTPKARTASKSKSKTKTVEEPKRLSKLGEWMRDHPKGGMEILDWDAVLQ